MNLLYRLKCAKIDVSFFLFLAHQKCHFIFALFLICPDCGTRQALESIGVKADEQAEILETIHRHMGMRQAG